MNVAGVGLGRLKVVDVERGRLKVVDVDRGRLKVVDVDCGVARTVDAGCGRLNVAGGRLTAGVNDFLVDVALAMLSVLVGEIVNVLPRKTLVRCVATVVVLPLLMLVLPPSDGIVEPVPTDTVEVIEAMRSGRARVVVGLTTVRVVAVEDTPTMVALPAELVPRVDVGVLMAGLVGPRRRACSLAFILAERLARALLMLERPDRNDGGSAFSLVTLVTLGLRGWILALTTLVVGLLRRLPENFTLPEEEAVWFGLLRMARAWPGRLRPVPVFAFSCSSRAIGLVATTPLVTLPDVLMSAPSSATSSSPSSATESSTWATAGGLDEPALNRSSSPVSTAEDALPLPRPVLT